MISDLIKPVSGLLDKFIPDKTEKMKIAHDLATMAEKHAHELAKGQLEVNKVEAAHKSLFVAGWRPYVGWVCGGAFTLHFIIKPILDYVLILFNIDPPDIDFDIKTLMTVLGGLLGLGGMRTYEKMKGVAREK